jgi:hypothetical protein
VSTSRNAGPRGEEQAAGPQETAKPDEAVMLRLSAQKLWSEGRANPVWYQCSTWVGTWTTEDRITWRTTDGKCVAQLERSANGRHISLAFYNQAGYMGRQDANGFHVPSSPRRAKRPRPLVRSLPLPLAG